MFFKNKNFYLNKINNSEKKIYQIKINNRLNSENLRFTNKNFIHSINEENLKKNKITRLENNSLENRIKNSENKFLNKIDTNKNIIDKKSKNKFYEEMLKQKNIKNFENIQKISNEINIYNPSNINQYYKYFFNENIPTQKNSLKSIINNEVELNNDYHNKILPIVQKNNTSSNPLDILDNKIQTNLLDFKKYSNYFFNKNSDLNIEAHNDTNNNYHTDSKNYFLKIQENYKNKTENINNENNLMNYFSNNKSDINNKVYQGLENINNSLSSINLITIPKISEFYLSNQANTDKNYNVRLSNFKNKKLPFEINNKNDNFNKFINPKNFNSEEKNCVKKINFKDYISLSISTSNSKLLSSDSTKIESPDQENSFNILENEKLNYQFFNSVNRKLLDCEIINNGKTHNN